MSVEKMVPEIRFKGFSGEWVENNLGGLAEIVRGASPRPIEDPKWFDKSSNVGWLRIRDVTEQDGRIHYLEQRISKLGQEKTRVLFDQNLLLSIAASVGKPVINYVETGVHDGFLIFKKPRFELEFMYQWLKSFELEWQQYGQPGSQVNLNSDIVKNQVVFTPCEKEQTAIGNTFQKLDSLINQHQQKHVKLSNIKKAMLEKMFPKQGETIPEIRFKGFSGEWKSSQLSELALFNPKEELPVTFKYVDLESVKGTTLLGYREELKESAPSRAQRLAKKGDVFFQTVRPYQKNNYLFNMEEIDFVFSTGYAQLRPYYDGSFLLNLIQQDSFVKDVLDNCTGTSYPAINASVLASLEVIYPETKEEQIAIGNYFQKLDALINQHQQQITKLNNIKQACLSKMFV